VVVLISRLPQLVVTVRQTVVLVAEVVVAALLRSTTRVLAEMVDQGWLLFGNISIKRK
jgi:hypothetical protein